MCHEARFTARFYEFAFTAPRVLANTCVDCGKIALSSVNNVLDFEKLLDQGATIVKPEDSMTETSE